MKLADMNIADAPWKKNFWSILAVMFFSFALWNVAFIAFALLARLVMFIIPLEMGPTAAPVSGRIMPIFTLLLFILTWIIFRSPLPDLMKAIWLTVPVVVSLVATGIMTYPNSWLAYGICSLIVIGFLVGLSLSKKPWIYYFATLFTAIVLLIFTLSGGEI